MTTSANGAAGASGTGKDFFPVKAGHDDVEYLKFETGHLLRGASDPIEILSSARNEAIFKG